MAGVSPSLRLMSRLLEMQVGVKKKAVIWLRRRSCTVFSRASSLDTTTTLVPPRNHASARLAPSITISLT